MLKPDHITKLDWCILMKKYRHQKEYLFKKIIEHYPIQYLIGNVDFYGNIINVNPSVLIPRFETEHLVEKTLQIISELNLSNPTIIDIGTGSGCIAISLAKEIKAQITAIDVSSEALKVAKENAKKHNVTIDFQQKDILEETELNYHVIISNPPYIKEDEYTAVETKYEPQNALFAKNNGLEFYEKILSIAKPNIKLIAFEIGETQGQEIIKLATSYFPNHQIILKKDYNNRDRYIFIY